MCLFERALFNAVETTWPTATKRGCYFHHKQALWKNLQNHDLVPEHNVDGSEVRKSFQQIGALTFDDLGDVEGSWQLLKRTLPSYERTWVGTSSSPILSLDVESAGYRYVPELGSNIADPHDQDVSISPSVQSLSLLGSNSEQDGKSLYKEISKR